MCPCVLLSQGEAQGPSFYPWDKSNQLQSHHQHPIPTAQSLRSSLTSWDGFCFLNSVAEGGGKDDLCINKVVGNYSSIFCSWETCYHFRILCPIWQGQREEDYSVLWDRPKEKRKHQGKKERKALQMNSQHKQSVSAQARSWSMTALNKSQWNQQLAK